METKYYTKCKRCGKRIDLKYYDEKKDICDSCQEKINDKYMDWVNYTDQFGNKVRVSRTTGDFQVKMAFWGWMGSFKGNMERRYVNGDLYVGGVYGSLRHGKGKMIWNKSGNSYDGDWVYDHQTGKGKFVWASGGYYEGDFVDGYFNGYGIRMYTDGCRYEGQFKDDKRHGKGKLTWPSGDVYEGDWFEDTRKGKGKYVWPNGVYYEGHFVSGNFEGKGFRTYIDGYTYKGQFKDDKRHGKGVLTAPDGTAVEYYYENDTRICKAEEATDEIIARICGSSKKVTVAPKAEEKTTVEPVVKKTTTVTPAVEKVTESDADVWNKLLGMSVAQRNDFLASHPNITVPAGVEKIPSNMFNNCLNLRSIRFNEDLCEIEAYAFMGCKNLGAVLEFPSSLKRICRFAFSTCNSIKKVILPNNITVDEAGLMCSVTEVEFETNPPIGVVLEKGAFRYCNMTMSKEMQKKIKDVSAKAFK